MNAEFNWWLLIVGLVVGAGLVWYVVFDGRRREIDIAETERAREATWLSAALADEGHDVSPATALRLLELHGLQQRMLRRRWNPDDDRRRAGEICRSGANGRMKESLR